MAAITISGVKNDLNQYRVWQTKALREVRRSNFD